MRIATNIEMIPWRGFDFSDPIAEMFTRIVAFLRIVLTLGKTQLSGLSLALEAKSVTRDARGNTSAQWSAYDVATKTRTSYASNPAVSNIASATSIDGLTMSSTDFAGVTTTFTYDALGRQLTVTDGRANTASNTYNAAGQLLTSTDPAGNVTRYTYSQLGNRISASLNSVGTFFCLYKNFFTKNMRKFDKVQ